MDWQQKFRWEDRNAGPLPGQNLASKVVQVKGTGDEMAETRIELAPYLKGSSGSFIVRVEPTNQPANRWERTDWIGWVQVSPLGLTAFSDTNELTGWVSSPPWPKHLPSCGTSRTPVTLRGRCPARRCSRPSGWTGSGNGSARPCPACRSTT